MAEVELTEPVQSSFDLLSEWNYAMSVYYQEKNKLATAQLYMQRARYHQEKEYAEAIKNRSLKRGTRFTNSPRSENPEIRRREDATAVAKVFYMRSRTRSPFIEEMPDWDELTQGTRDYMINDAKEAIRVLDARRNAGKVNS